MANSKARLLICEDDIPTLALVMILALPGVFAAADPVLILTQGSPQGSTQTLAYYTYETAFMKGDLRLGYASAISLVMSLATSFFAVGVFLWSREKN